MPDASRRPELPARARTHNHRTNIGAVNDDLHGSAPGAALGRSSLLSPQPDQSDASPRQRAELPVLVQPGAEGPRHGGADRLAGGDDDAAGGPLLLRAERL